MRWRESTIDGIRLFGERTGLSLSDSKSEIFPGQIFIGFREKDHHLITLYPVANEIGNFWWIANLNTDVEIGEKIKIKGPVGAGFTLPGLAGNLLVLNFCKEEFLIYYPVQEAVNRNINVSLCSTQEIFDLHPAVDILRTEDLQAGLNWADVVWLIIEDYELENLILLFPKLKHAAKKIQVYFPMMFLCSGKAECMVCAIKTKYGWKKSCKEGLVYRLDELEDF